MRKKRIIVYSLLVLLTGVFIFYNSCMNAEKSIALSDIFAVNIFNVRSTHESAPASGGEQNGDVSADDGKATEPEKKEELSEEEKQEYVKANKFVRKTAHMTEFFILGINLLLLLHEIFVEWSSKLIYLYLFITLFTGVADEFVQSFFDRTSLVKDVLIDFGGSCAAALLVTAAAYIKNKKRNKG